MGRVEYWNQPGTGMRMQISDPGNIDNVLRSIKGALTGRESIRINTAGAEVYKKNLKENFLAHLRPDVEGGEPTYHEDAKSIPYDHQHNRDDMADTIIVAHERFQTQVGVGFSTEGKLGFVGRFINDGWDPRNKYGGPYGHVPGEFYFEKTEVESEDEVKEAMAKKLNRILGEIQRRGGQVIDDSGGLSPVGESDGD